MGRTLFSNTTRKRKKMKRTTFFSELREPKHDQKNPATTGIFPGRLTGRGRSPWRAEPISNRWSRGRNGFIAGLVSLALLLSPGCGTEPDSRAVSFNAPAWNWEFYPPLPRMRIATLPCQLLPKSSITIHSPLVGLLRVNVKHPQIHLPTDFVWAEFEPALLEAEAADLEEARRKLEEREQMTFELEVPRHQLRLTREIEEAQRQLKILSLLSTNQELAGKAFQFGAGGAALKPEALEKAQVELSLLEHSMSYLQRTNLAVIGVDLAAQRSEWQRRKREFDRRQTQARLKMPFEGQLTVSLPLTEGVDEYPVNTSQELAVARDLSQIRLRVPLSNPSWASLPTDRISAVVRLPTGEELHAPFAFKKIERVQLREESVYYFEFHSEQAAAAAQLIGTDVSCEIWLALPRPARVVPKYSLVLEKPEAFQGRSWAQGVNAAWPGAQVLVEGQTAVAIVLPNDPQTL
jgi:hypothetical protein